MDLEYYKLFYNLPHNQRLLMILMKSFKKDLDECKNKNSEFYIAKSYTEHINLISKSINTNTSLEDIKPTTTNNTIKVNDDIEDKPTTNTTLNTNNNTNNDIEDINPNTNNNIEINNIEIFKKDNNNIEIVKKDNNNIEVNNISINSIEDIINEFDKKMGKWEVSSSDNDYD